MEDNLLTELEEGGMDVPDWAKAPDPAQTKAAKKAEAAATRKEAAAAKAAKVARRKREQAEAYEHIHGVEPTDEDLAGFRKGDGCACGPLCCVPFGQRGRSCVTKTASIFSLLVWGMLLSIIGLKDMSSVTGTSGRSVYNVFGTTHTSVDGEHGGYTPYTSDGWCGPTRSALSALSALSAVSALSASDGWCGPTRSALEVYFLPQRSARGVRAAALQFALPMPSHRGRVPAKSAVRFDFCTWDHRAFMAVVGSSVVLPFAAAFFWWASKGTAVETSKTVKSHGRTSTTVSVSNSYQTDGKCVQLIAFLLSAGVSAGCVMVVVAWGMCHQALGTLASQSHADVVKVGPGLFVACAAALLALTSTYAKGRTYFICCQSCWCTPQCVADGGEGASDASAA